MRSRNITSLLLVCLFFVVISIGIGYAYVRDSLSLNGNSTLASNSFNVYFDNIVINKETARVNTAANIYNDGKSVGFNVTLTKPGDTYDFYVDVVNGGSIDAMVGIVPSIEIPDEYKDVVLYKITYEDGIQLTEKDLLKAANNDLDKNNKVNIETLHIVMKYKLSTNNEQLVTTDMPSFNVNFDIPYVQAKDGNEITRNSLYELISSKAISDAIQSEFVTSEMGIDYKYQSSDTNGKGLYKYREQISKEYPIYYYRGEVYDNNVIFANYCWKIVRTTETGGIKLIYNGTPSNGVCNNANSDDVLPQIRYTDEHEFGGTMNFDRYIMGDTISRYVGKSSFRNDDINGLVFGNDVVYENGHYKLVDTYTALSPTVYDDNAVAQRHHYTCMTTSDTCTEVYYIYRYDYNYNPSNFTYSVILNPVILKNGMKITEAFDEFMGRSARYDSLAKKQVDTFYKDNLIDYENNIEDAVWCLDSRFDVNIFDKDTNINVVSVQPSFYNRQSNTHLPDITCDINDSFTVTTKNGNGKLNYMTGAITVDELMLAGYNISSTNNYHMSSLNNFLTASSGYWTMSSYGTYSSVALYYIRNTGDLNNGSSYYDGYGGMRPMISLRNDTLYSSGDGTIDNPYVIVER